MSEVTGSCEDNDGYQAVDKYREHGIESSRYEKDSDFFSLKSKKNIWKSQSLKTENRPYDSCF